ncbi:MAG: DegV family protein [Clostridia bacterium]|nr:DegV family protein [Clostridia bacterium]
MKLLISTDTSCLLNYETLTKYDISVFPLNVIIDGEEFLDGVTIKQPELISAMRAGKKIQTSTPPLGDVISYFEKLFEKGYDHVIHFTISSKLSSMNNLFNSVAEEHFKGKVTIIDAYTVSAPMLSYVLLAYDMASSGSSPEEIVKAVEEAKGYAYLIFIPENLTALKNGGRISPTIALIGNAIGIKPVLLLDDGEIKKEDMTRKARAVLEQKIKDMATDKLPSEYDYSVLSFDANEYLLNYICEVTETVTGNKPILGAIPINVGAHCGPGTIGVAITKKINGKSLKDFM